MMMVMLTVFFHVAKKSGQWLIEEGSVLRQCNLGPRCNAAMYHVRLTLPGRELPGLPEVWGEERLLRVVVASLWSVLFQLAPTSLSVETMEINRYKKPVL